jgi:hypothetical protein
MTTVEHQRVTLGELRDTLDRLTQERLGLTVDEFLERCRARTLDVASPAISRLAVLGRLLLEAGGERQR